MNNKEVYREILELWEQGLSLLEIAEKTAAPAKIVQYCLAHPEFIVRNSASALLKVLRSGINLYDTPIFESYAYILEAI